jgi:hypothetical protein
MICTTIREGVECPFMTSKGCSYNGGICHEIVEQCDGCDRKIQMQTAWYCAACPEPAIKWKVGSCNMATHLTSTSAQTTAKINPLKASKRLNKKK